MPLCDAVAASHRQFEDCVRKLFANPDFADAVQGRCTEDLSVYGKRMCAPVELFRHILDASGLHEVSLTLWQVYNGVGARTWWWVTGNMFSYDTGADSVHDS